jgi:hypothetical protein
VSYFKNHDPKRYVVVFGGHQVQGYASGTFVQVARESDSFSDEVGAGGDVVRSRTHDKRGSVTITLQAASPSNDVLSAFVIADELGVTVNAGVKPLLVKDLNGTTVATAAEAWVQKPAEIEGAAEHTNREWVIRCAQLNINVGGSIL